jgi:hypothetical protein
MFLAFSWRRVWVARTCSTALLGAHHVDDPVADVAHREELDAVVLDVAG